MSGYYCFNVYNPKLREIHALHYIDRVVQHSICDNVLGPLLERKLIYDNTACRKDKGTHFAMDRVSRFMRDYYNKYGSDGWVLKCDVRKFFDNIDHKILKQKLQELDLEKPVLWLLHEIIDSYECSLGKGLPLGNQTSQWFAIYYLDSFDRLIEEKLGIKYYSRYMDDAVLIHPDREYLKVVKKKLEMYEQEVLYLELNEKTQIFPLKNGVDYLGFHFYLTDTGKVIRKVRTRTKKKYRKRLKQIPALTAAKSFSAQLLQTVQRFTARSARQCTKSR